MSDPDRSRPMGVRPDRSAPNPTDRGVTDPNPTDAPTERPKPTDGLTPDPTDPTPWLTGAAAAAACVGMDCCGGPTGRVLPVETTDRYAEHARWDDAAHLLAGYSLGVVLGADGADRSTTVRRFLVVASAWEAFEYAIGERPWDGSTTTRGAVIDTVMDTVMGATGAFVAASLSE